MRLMLTDRFCARAKPAPDERQTDYFDEAVSGLALRVGREKAGTSQAERKAGAIHDRLVPLDVSSRCTNQSEGSQGRDRSRPRSTSDISRNVQGHRGGLPKPRWRFLAIQG